MYYEEERTTVGHEFIGLIMSHSTVRKSEYDAYVTTAYVLFMAVYVAKV
jgi:hypothetical protein